MIRKKKEKGVMIVGLVVAVSMLVTTAFAGNTKNTGYEVFKDVMKTHHGERPENGRLTGNMEITDNGKSILKLEGSFAGDKNEKEMSGDIKLISDSLNKQIAVYGFDNTLYISDSESNDVYVGKKGDNKRPERFKKRMDRDSKNCEFSDEAEAIMDYFVGDLKNEFELVEDSDGTQDIKFELTKSEVPTIVNLLTSLKSKKMQNNDRHEKFAEKMDLDKYPLLKEIYDFKTNAPRLVEDVEVEYLNIAMDLDENQKIKNIAVEASFSGLDENQEEHLVTIKTDLSITEINNAEITPMDTDGKNLIDLPKHERQHRFNH